MIDANDQSRATGGSCWAISHSNVIQTRASHVSIPPPSPNNVIVIAIEFLRARAFRQLSSFCGPVLSAAVSNFYGPVLVASVEFLRARALCSCGEYGPVPLITVARDGEERTKDCLDDKLQANYSIAF
jgi:hypothetical protein